MLFLQDSKICWIGEERCPDTHGARELASGGFGAFPGKRRDALVGRAFPLARVDDAMPGYAPRPWDICAKLVRGKPHLRSHSD